MFKDSVQRTNKRKKPKKRLIWQFKGSNKNLAKYLKIVSEITKSKKLLTSNQSLVWHFKRLNKELT